MAKKGRITPSQNWSNIHDDLFDMIVTRLPFVDTLHLRGVCTSWRSMAKTKISKILGPSTVFRFPILMHRTYDKFVDFDESEWQLHRSLFEIEDRNLEKIRSIPKETCQNLCLGSSHDWLLFFDENHEKYRCFNPFFDLCISLSSLPKLPFTPTKVILSSDAILSGGKCTIVALDGSGSRIAHAMRGDSSWSYNFSCDNFPYSGISCYNFPYSGISCYKNSRRKKQSEVFFSSILSRSPLLAHPTNDRVVYFNGSECKLHRSLFEIDDINLKIIKGTPKETWHSSCIGSSHGWLLFFDENQEKYRCFNPFLDLCIILCSLPKLPFTTTKVILSSDPIVSGGKCAIVALDESGSRITYGMCGDSSWGYFSCKNFPYSDITCNKNFVFALAESGSVEVWDFSTCKPSQSFSIEPPFCQELIYGPNGALAKLYDDINLYLVWSKDELLMVVRYIVESDPLYWTKKFDVYKLDKEGKWAKKDDLGDMLLILGANHSVSKAAGDLEGYEKNKIYFTDDNRRLMNASPKVAGKDIGVYSFGEEYSDRIKISPSIATTFWVVP